MITYVQDLRNLLRERNFNIFEVTDTKYIYLKFDNDNIIGFAMFILPNKRGKNYIAYCPKNIASHNLPNNYTLPVSIDKLESLK